MQDLRIHYLFVEATESLVSHSVFHLLRLSEMRMLRGFMAWLQLPSHADRILPSGRPFWDALLRVRQVPTFRKASVTAIADAQWKDLQELPLLCLMLEHDVPSWLAALAKARPVIAMSQFDETLEEVVAAGVPSGLLRGPDDLKNFHSVLQGLCTLQSKNQRFDAETRRTLEGIGAAELFARRSRLGFIPPIALPKPEHGRAAAYLLNRLSNNVDEPYLDPDSQEDAASQLPEILRCAVRATASLAMFESGDDLTEGLQIARADLEEAHSALVSGTDERQKFDILMTLGKRVAADDFLSSPFITVPAARLDVISGRVPEGVKLEPEHRGMIKPGRQALRDYLSGKAADSPTGSDRDATAYTRAHETLLLEQRFLSCETACLASRTGSIPFHLPVADGEIYNTVRALNQAIDANSKKVSAMFRDLERALAALIPAPIRDVLANGDSTVQILSDLPFEWAMIEEWPLCLTRPVSRIPLGLTDWEVLSAALEQDAVIGVKTPEKVLVFDLIAAHESIRRYSDSFASISEGLSQNYEYARPADVREFRNALERSAAEIVVLDSHGRYDRSRDEVWVSMPDGPVALSDLLPDQRVPAVWILSACDTSVTGAMRGCFVKRLLEKGALCVIATLAPVDAFTAELFVGRLLTDLYNPVKPGAYASFDRLFFATQYTTALLYDPLLPLFKRAERDASLKRSLGRVLAEYFSWAAKTPIGDVRRFRHDVAWFVGTSLARHGLTEVYEAAQNSGNVKPQTLLFSAFGCPKHVRLA